MKKILNLILVTSVMLSVASCGKDFLESDPFTSVDASEAFKVAKDFENAIHGVYATAGDFRFFGRNVLAVGDLAAQTMWMAGSSGHFDAIYRYTLTPSQADLTNIYNGGYAVIDQATRIIHAAPGVLDGLDPNIAYKDIDAIYSVLAQAHGLKALAYFVLVNFYALPYDPTTINSNPGIVLVDEPIDYFVKHEFTKKSVGEVYDKILEHLDEAFAYMDEYLAYNNDLSKAYLNNNALHALAARVHLYMGDWATARDYAESVTGSLANEATYTTMWRSLSATSEDIFYIAKSAQDNLTANSLNTLYGSYSGRVQPGLTAMFDAGDFRGSLIGAVGNNRTTKFSGSSAGNSVSNIPIFRYSEILLIIAETYAQEGDLENGVEALFEVAQRNSSLTLEGLKADLNTKELLIAFIHEERLRELYAEGHNLFDVRRYTTVSPRPTMSRLPGSQIKNVQDWKAYEWVFPFPQREVQLGVGINQTPNWQDARP